MMTRYQQTTVSLLKEIEFFIEHGEGITDKGKVISILAFCKRMIETIEGETK